MTRNDYRAICSDVIAALRGAEGASPAIVEHLETLQHELEDDLFGGRPLASDHYNVRADDIRVAILLDALEALSLMHPDDASYPWDRGLVLKVVGRHAEAAHEYLAVADAVRQTLQSESVPEDYDDDWAQAALFHAATSFALAGQHAAAATLLARLDPDDRAEVEPLFGVSESA
jgi:hypothetical protein